MAKRFLSNKILVIAISIFAFFATMFANVNVDTSCVALNPGTAIEEMVSLDGEEILASANVDVKIDFFQTAEASSSWKKWAKDVRRDIRRDFRNEVRRNIRRDISRWEREQRNIIRADGDARFANHYLSDRELRALRILKRCPVGESQIFLMPNDISAVKSICRILPEFVFIGVLKDPYNKNESIGAAIGRHY